MLCMWGHISSLPVYSSYLTEYFISLCSSPSVLKIIRRPSHSQKQSLKSRPAVKRKQIKNILASNLSHWLLAWMKTLLTLVFQTAPWHLIVLLRLCMDEICSRTEHRFAIGAQIPPNCNIKHIQNVGGQVSDEADTSNRERGSQNGKANGSGDDVSCLFCSRGPEPSYDLENFFGDSCQSQQSALHPPSSVLEPPMASLHVTSSPVFFFRPQPDAELGLHIGLFEINSLKHAYSWATPQRQRAKCLLCLIWLISRSAWEKCITLTFCFTNGNGGCQTRMCSRPQPDCLTKLPTESRTPGHKLVPRSRWCAWLQQALFSIFVLGSWNIIPLTSFCRTNFFLLYLVVYGGYFCVWWA